ncbi:putative phage transcriptional regulator [Acinetobacter guillouiae]|uniref:LexA family protein n=1 Tax=Acinetobacter guillouiae TaxID=106649 RepID=UPI0004EF6425|nr:S24 family peptidase [Acinetobacter guillouiae]BAP36658.1 putative phage transcriptional regulator [Acinetobacter guillouiae]
METVGTRIKKLRKQKKFTLKELASKVGVSDVSISNWENDVNTPKHEHLTLLAPNLDTTIDFIMYGKTEDTENVSDFRPVTRMLPVLTYIQCGTMTNVKSIAPHEIEMWLPAPPDASKNSFYLICQGISNAPEFKDGDFVCINPDIPFDNVQHGEMIAVCQDDEATFKALVREFNSLHLKALNENFHPNIIPLKEDFIYKGKYVGKFTPPKKFI